MPSAETYVVVFGFLSLTEKRDLKTDEKGDRNKVKNPIFTEFISLSYRMAGVINIMGAYRE